MYDDRFSMTINNVSKTEKYFKKLSNLKQKLKKLSKTKEKHYKPERRLKAELSALLQLRHPGGRASDT